MLHEEVIINANSREVQGLNAQEMLLLQNLAEVALVEQKCVSVQRAIAVILLNILFYAEKAAPGVHELFFHCCPLSRADGEEFGADELVDAVNFLRDTLEAALRHQELACWVDVHVHDLRSQAARVSRAL